MKNKTKKIFYSFVLLLIFYISLTFLIKDNLWIAINTTRSLPDKFFIIKKSPNYLNKGDIITFNFIQKNNPYYKYKSKFVKINICTEGNYLKVISDKYYCDDRLFAVAMKNDSKKNPIKNFVFDGIIPVDNYFVIGSAFNSYDSRYWGLVNKENITGVVLW